MTNDEREYIEPARGEWKERLARRKSGAPYGDERNVMIALEHAPLLRNRLQHNEFADQIEITSPFPWHHMSEIDAMMDWEETTWTDADRIELQIWLQAQGIPVSKANVTQDAVIACAHRRAYHPVREWLKGLQPRWDKKPRIKTWLVDYLGASDNLEYLEEIGPKFLIGACARIMQPGCQMDTMLVLEGATGLGKSTLVRLLSNGWYCDVFNDLANKDAAMGIQGVFIGELAEMTAIARSQTEAMKGFISRPRDTYRPPYGRNVVTRPRQVVFISTTNEHEYLNDVTGNRRFWPVDCSKVDLDALARDRDQLWAEAMMHWAHGFQWHLTEPGILLARREQELRRKVSVLEEKVLEYCDRRRADGVVRISMRDFLTQACGVAESDLSPAVGVMANNVMRVLTANGWLKQRPRGRAKRRVVMYEYVAARDPNFDADAKSQDPSQDMVKTP